jgi:hypothetical protein
MTARPNPNRAISEWLAAEAEAEAPERLLTATRRRLGSTQQRRAWWPARRNQRMQTPLRLAVAAAAVLTVAVVGINLMPGQGPGGAGASPAAAPSPTASASPTAAASPPALPVGAVSAGTYVFDPSTHPAWTACPQPDTPGCTDPVAAEDLRFTVAVPEGWAGIGAAVWLPTAEAAPPDGASLGFARGSWLHSDPCRGDVPLPDYPEIEVGPSVDDFVNALVDHRELEVTTPVEVTVAGYSGKYVDLQIPSDISGCPTSYFVWEPGIYAQGPAQRWHLWVVDVDGVRVVVHGTSYAGTSPQHRADLQAMVDSIQILP